MTRIVAILFCVSVGLTITGCGEDKTKPAAGGGGSTTPATVKAPPKGEKPKME